MPSFCFSSQTAMHHFIKQEAGLKFAQAPQRPWDPAWILITNHPGLKDGGGNAAFQHRGWCRGNAKESELDTGADFLKGFLTETATQLHLSTKGICGLEWSQKAREPGVEAEGHWMTQMPSALEK